MTCPICGAPSEVLHERMCDDRYGYPGVYDLLRCTGCGHIHLDARFDPGELSHLYTRYYPRSAFKIEQHNVPRESRGIGAWLRGGRCAAFRWVPERVRVLDIGCGFCESLGYHRARGCDAYGVEADANVRRIADHFGYNVHVGLFDPELYESGFFDYVTLDQVIEHVVDPHETMRGVARILKPGGTAVLSTPNPNGWGRRLFGRRWVHWHIPYHLQQYTRRSMRILAEKSGLNVVKATTLTHSEWTYYQFVHLIALPSCGTPHPFWAGKNWATNKEKRLVRIAARVHSLRLFQLMTRACDALGIGDNNIFILRKPTAD